MVVKNNDVSLSKKVSLYESVTKKHKLYNVNNKPYWNAIFPLKKLEKSEILQFWNSFLDNNSNPLLCLYIHTPFCKDKRCTYCMYRSFILKNPEIIDSYLDFLEREVNFFKSAFKDKKFSTLYFGGGTPSILNVKQLSRLFDLIFDNFSFYDDKGTKSFEVSPTTFTKEKVLLAISKGINRISMGVQSFDKFVMTASNREHHPYNNIKEIIDFLKVQDGLLTFNIDLMAMLPEDKIQIFIEGLEFLLKNDVPSVTIYFYRFNHYCSDDDSYSKAYDSYKEPYNRYDLINAVKELLKNYNYNFDELENSEFLNIYKKDYPRYMNNLTQFDWHLMNSTLGLGLFSRSFIQGSLNYFNSLCNLKNLDFENLKYLALINSTKEQMRNYVLLNLQCGSKISFSDFKDKFDRDFLEVFEKEVSSLKKLGKVKFEEDSMILLPSDFEDLNVHLKFFYNQEYLKALAEK